MRKILIQFVLLATICFLSCCSRQQEKEWTAGVSRELAEMRKTSLSGLKYKLYFNIPGLKSESVDGNVSISFVLQKRQDVVLDFREDSVNVKKVIVNGRETDYEFKNEHIVIPGGATVKGQNEVEISFVAGNQSLNRNDEYLYTLLVPDRARTLFPCFDQPDLKALFTLSVEIPGEWAAVSNTLPESQGVTDGRKRVVFEETEPLSTYLFSFVAGKMDKITETREGRTISLYHRETDLRKLAQAPVIFDQVYASLDWLEEYTGIPYPFAKYELVILPGFQYGGMEHTGATLYNDKRLFLGEYPTVDEELGRMELIAHETAHMWFGDYVTMVWFDDVWTKEVFANYFAALMTEPQFPAINHELNALKNFRMASYSEDRTAGTNAIKQELDNLNNAGLVYGQIVYNKAPLVMKMLVELMGSENFQKGIREYLKTYAYSNATWEDLIRILDKYTPQELESWSRVWVNERGMPDIRVSREEGRARIEQQDPLGRKIVWPQDIQLLLLKENGAGGTGWTAEKRNVRLYDSVVYCNTGFDADYILPDTDGKGYGNFVPDEISRDFCLRHIADFSDPLLRLSLSMMLYENMLNSGIQPSVFVVAMLDLLKTEKDPLIYSSVMSYVRSACVYYTRGENTGAERALLELSMRKGDPARQLIAFRALLDIFIDPEIAGSIFAIWDNRKPFDGLPLNESDYMKMAYELAVRFPEKYDYIIGRQSARIENPDRQKEFMFISRAITPAGESRDTFFNSLLEAENRRVEPWASKALFYLNHPLRQEQALKYIRPSLEELKEVQRTGDIFFPKNWVASCLSGHNSSEAARIVSLFLEEYPAYPVLLKNKILQSADHLFRIARQK